MQVLLLMISDVSYVVKVAIRIINAKNVQIKFDVKCDTIYRYNRKKKYHRHTLFRKTKRPQMPHIFS